MDDLGRVLTRTLELVATSRDPLGSAGDVASAVKELEFQLQRLEGSLALDPSLVRLMFAPTGSLQDISIHNGWGEGFLLLASQVHKFLQELRPGASALLPLRPTPSAVHPRRP